MIKRLQLLLLAQIGLGVSLTEFDDISLAEQPGKPPRATTDSQPASVAINQPIKHYHRSTSAPPVIYAPNMAAYQPPPEPTPLPTLNKDELRVEISH